MALASDTAIEWDARARALYEELMRQGPPEALKESASATVAREAERGAIARGATQVEDADVARACLRAAPAAFRPRVAESLTRRGFDVAALLAPGAAPPAGFDSEWDAVHARIVTHREEVARIYGMRAPTGPLRVLDLACGTGKHLLEFARDGHRCHGVDQQQWKLDKAARRARELGLEVGFTCGDLTRVVLPERYDLVVCLYALSTLRGDGELLAGLGAAARALAPDGVFVFNVVNKAANGDPQHSMHRAVHVEHHLRDHTIDELRALLPRAGLVVRRFEYATVMSVPALDLFVSATHAEGAHVG